MYFTAALRGKANYGKNHDAIVGVLKEMGCRVLSDVVSPDVVERVEKQTIEEREEAYSSLSQMMRESDLVVAEISTASTSVGHEVTEALGLSKPVILLYTTQGNKAVLLEECKNEKLQIIEYDLDNLSKRLKEAVGLAVKMMDVRFNFFVSPKMLEYLDWAAKKENTSKLAIIRELIKGGMERNKWGKRRKVGNTEA